VVHNVPAGMCCASHTTNNHSTKFNLKTKMTITQFLITYPIPFVLVFIVMGLNEYRLYKNKSIDYKSFTNSMAMLLMSLLSFMLCQALLSKW